MNARGVSFHLFDLPGYPASHACVRLLLRDAQWLYGWGEQWKLDETGRVVVVTGTPVLILGTYPLWEPGAVALAGSPDDAARAAREPAFARTLIHAGVGEPSGVAAAGGSLRSDSGR